MWKCGLLQVHYCTHIDRQRLPVDSQVVFENDIWVSNPCLEFTDPPLVSIMGEENLLPR